MKVKPKLPGRQGARLSQAWSGEYCLSANNTSNLILQRFLQRRKQRDVRRMWNVYSSICIFYHGHILQDLSHQLFVTGSQLFIFQEHYHLLPFIYLPCIIMRTRSSIFSSLSSPSVICYPASWCNALEWLTLWGWKKNDFPLPPHQGIHKRAPNQRLIQPNVRTLQVEIHLCVLEQVFLWDPQRNQNSWKQENSPTPFQEIEASLCCESHFYLKHQAEIIACLLGIDSWVFSWILLSFDSSK